jgi:uncharacterized HAD superfamily protein
MKIGIDLDDTAVDLVGAFVSYYNKNYNGNLKRGDFEEYSFNYPLKKPLDEILSIIDSFYKTKYFKNMSPIRDSVLVLHLLKQKHDLYLVTSRPDFLTGETEDLLEKKFPNSFSDIFYSYNHYSKRKNSGKTKAEICLEVGISLMIDDSLDYCMQCAKSGIKTFLFGNYPWNQNGNLLKNITRTENWKEVLKKL